MKKILMRAGVVGTAMLPFIPLAAAEPNFMYPISVLGTIKTFIGALAPLVFAGAVLGFLIGVGMYLFSAGNDKMKAKAQDVMKWGLIALVVMFSVYGIIQLIATVFGVEVGGTLRAPGLPGIN